MEMGPATRYILRCNTAGIIKSFSLFFVTCLREFFIAGEFTLLRFTIKTSLFVKSIIMSYTAAAFYPTISNSLCINTDFGFK